MNTQETCKNAETKPDSYTLLGTGWVSIEETQPKPQERVYVVCENPKYGGGVVRFQTMAEYIPPMTVKEEDYMADEYQGEGDYNEEEDEYYTPEGFYEWRSEQLTAFAEYCDEEHGLFIPSWMIDEYNKSR